MIRDCHKKWKLLQSETEPCYKVWEVLKSVARIYREMCGVLQSVSTITKSDVTHKYISQNHDYKQLHILESEKHGQ